MPNGKMAVEMGEGSLRIEPFKPSLGHPRRCLRTRNAHHNKKASYNCGECSVPTVSASEHTVPSCWGSFGWFGGVARLKAIAEASLWLDFGFLSLRHSLFALVSCL